VNSPYQASAAKTRTWCDRHNAVTQPLDEAFENSTPVSKAVIWNIIHVLMSGGASDML
jgi:hypothetical protein